MKLFLAFLPPPPSLYDNICQRDTQKIVGKQTRNAEEDREYQFPTRLINGSSKNWLRPYFERMAFVL